MSDDGLDAELLAMAGDSSDDEGEINSPQQLDDGEVSDEPKPIKEKKEKPAIQRGVAQKVRANRRRKRKQESEDEDDFGGDGSSSPAGSMGSGAMDGSDSEADARASPGVDEGPLYPLEGKYLSSRDREEIMAMPEIKREEILAERAQEVTKRQQDLQLQKALAVAQAASNKHKRKAAAADLEDSGRRTTRPKAEKGRSALDEYRRAREMKGDRGRLERRSDRRDARSPSSASDRDADGESEVEWAEPSSSRRDEPPAELKDFERCRVGRSNFAKICFYPNFEGLIKGCFCRISIGMNRETGQNMYRMTQIRGFTEGKPYSFESSNGKPFTTDQYAVVAHGNAEKAWPFSSCSDSHFSDSELDRLLATLRKEELRIPSKKYLSAKLSDIHELLNTKWTDKEISSKLAKQRAMAKKFDPANAANLKREAITKRKVKAEDEGDTDEVTKCDAELAALENNSSSNVNGPSIKPKPSPAKNGALARQESLAALNAKNRGKNAEEVRKALLEERRKILVARKAFDDKRKAEEEEKKLLAVPKNDMADLFGEGSDVSRAGTPGAGTPKRSRAGTPLNGVKREKSALGGLMKKKSLDDEVIGNMDLGIDIEI